jgi:tRNA threonylcarbamoyladenosine biosynthesis protein TsaE
MIRLHTTSAASTQQLAHAMAQLVEAGDVILLAGELGAGKTAFSQGFALGLGVTEQVTSPTFTLVREYEGRLPLIHCDVYRLEFMNEVADLGLAELLDGDGVVLIEWGDAIASILGRDHLEVRITYGDGDDERNFVLTPLGPRWGARTKALAAALGQWSAP